MDIDEQDDEDMLEAVVEDHGIEIDFSGLDEELKEVSQP
jgi:structural maintenance of chromosome 1